MAISVNPYEYVMEQRAKNPFWPMPPDYADFTQEGQKEARLTALADHRTPLSFVGAWDLFRRIYLMTTPPGFFYHELKPSPPFHYEAIYDCQAHRRNLVGAPRGFAKSIVIGTELPLFLLLTKPYIRIVLSLATDKLIESRFDTIMGQLTKNEFILEDFGELKPKRGDAIWNRHHIQLLNGSKMEGFSVTGRKRGARPDIFILDDPEYDPETDSEDAAQIIKQKFETFLFRQVIPMLEAHASIFWIGTMIGRRSFIYHACTGDDPRFDFWNRKVYSAGDLDGDKMVESSLLWGAKWSKATLDERRASIGAAAFAAEYQNNPISSEERTLKIHETKTEYTIPEFNRELFDEDPLIYPGEIKAYKLNPTTRRWDEYIIPCKKFFDSLFRVITFDPARGLGPHHDYSCITVMGIDTENCVWVLDMWMGRATESHLLNQIYKMGLRWRPRVLGIESIAMQIQLHGSMKTLLEERKAGGWSPAVVPVDYRQGNKRRTKAERISTLEWRFDAGKIKYPAHLKEVWPISQLYVQTQDFTYDLAMLRFDDAIDSVAMIHYVVHGQGAKNFPVDRDPTIADRIRAGQLTSAGVPLLSGMNSEELNKEEVEALMARSYQMGYTGIVTPDTSHKPYFVRRIIPGR